MNVCLCSAFRNAESYYAGYYDQVYNLAWQLEERGDSLQIIWCEGDSQDATFTRLTERKALMEHFVKARVELFQHAHGGKDYGPAVHPERFRQLANLWNEIWQRIPENADVVVFCESDLIWEPATIIALIDSLTEYPAIAPMVMEQSTGGFYDTWAYVKNKTHFNKHEPYFYGWPVTEPTQIDSAGSLIVMRGDLARRLTWPEADVCVGLCRQTYELGDLVYLHPGLTVTHP